MKKFIKYFSILTILLFTSSGLKAKEISGSLSAGEGSSFIPIQGSAFSIIRDVTSGIYGGNYDILIKIGGRVVYKERNQPDDLYLIFNESISSGDIIKIDVNRGIFLFKMSQMDTLPDVIVDAIKKQAPKEYEELKPLHHRKKRRPKEETTIQRSSIVKKESVNETKTKEIDESRVIKRHITPQEYKKEIAKSSLPKELTDKSILGKRVSTPKFQKPSDDLNQFSNSIDSIKKGSTLAAISKNHEIDKESIKSDIEDVALKSRVTTPQITVSKLPTPSSLPNEIEQVDNSIGTNLTLPTRGDTKIESFTRCTPPTVSSSNVDNYNQKISSAVVEQPKFQNDNQLVEIKSVDLEESVPEFSQSRIEPDVQEPQPVVENIPEVIEQTPQPKIEKIVEPELVKREIVIEDDKPKDRIVITKMIQKPKKRVLPDDEPRVIKRHVDPEEYKRQQQEEIPERMSDRVLGGGYADIPTSTLQVKAYSNNRPISAWVEVFRADTKKRVKTFYTGKGRTLKDIKLPAGVYVIKATYRTAGSKRKKTIGRIRLQEGESINKKITFDDGSVIVKVKKGGKPIYAKVEVFKSGKKRRVTYEFTSRSTGIAKLSLGTGLYDIVVHDHGNIKRFNSINVKGGKAKNIYANF